MPSSSGFLMLQNEGVEFDLFGCGLEKETPPLITHGPPPGCRGEAQVLDCIGVALAVYDIRPLFG